MDFINQKSLLGNLWKLVEADERAAELIAQRHNLPMIISKILASRHILVDEVESFIDPKLQHLLPNPSVLKDMDKAASKIADQIMTQGKVGIIGDYDVDGATSSSVLKIFLETNGVETVVHIPEREEGYGPSQFAFDKFAALGINFVVTTDCGTTAFEAFDYAKTQGFDVIVLDHHEAETKLPNVYALVNPKRLDQDLTVSYLKYLAAVGVVFLTVVAINRELRTRGFYHNRQEPNLMSYLDLVALGTVCDVVPLLGLNRAFVKQGLKIMANRQNTGLKALIDKSGITECPSAYHLGYVLGPRINAGGRVGDSSLGSKLLSSRDDAQASRIAEQLNQHNVERKDIESYVLLNAIEILEGSPQEYPIAFVYGHDWHQGVIGIVAGKLKERYNVPAFVMSVESDEVKGSSRSIDGLDLGALIIAAKEQGLLTKGGGHMMAAGFSLTEDKIEDFRKFVGQYVNERLGQDKIVPVIEADACLDLLGANIAFSEKMDMLQPYGAGNPEPKLIIQNVMIKKPKIVGSGHVSCFFSSKNGGSMKAIAFRAGDTELGQHLLNNQGESYNFIGTLRKDSWQGRESLQFIIEDGMLVA